MLNLIKVNGLKQRSTSRFSYWPFPKFDINNFADDFSLMTSVRSSRSEMFLVKGVLKICSKFTGGHPCQNVISIKMQSSFIEITLQHGCSPVNLLHIFRRPFTKNTSEQLLLIFAWSACPWIHLCNLNSVWKRI